MDWLELSVQASPELVEPLVELFQRYGRRQVVVEEAGGFNPDEGESAPTGGPVIVRAYVMKDRRSADRVARIHAGVQLMGLIKPLSPLAVRTVTPWEWEEAWKAHFQPLRIGRLVVRPTWQEVEAAEGDIVLTLDPGLAFGTGHHPTTRMCLEQLERRVEPGMRILDLGTGSGLLSQAALLLGAEWALALDTEADAIRASRRNLKAAGLSRQVRIVRGTLPHIQAVGAGPDRREYLGEGAGRACGRPRGDAQAGRHAHCVRGARRTRGRGAGRHAGRGVRGAGDAADGGLAGAVLSSRLVSGAASFGRG